ncbi:hypothetical protein EG327_008121 [Venturia inaequalis]|uniref:Uncharacterized protein n=1 Tax=Venturia inaequalis TaxID=5025 RepID=A0A8H3VRG8_VENIN|nr:hypothetical protein EG327_008121 [Venturia inaequalis]
MYTGKLEELYANYVGNVLGPPLSSEVSLTDLDGADLNTDSSRYIRLERPCPPPPPPESQEPTPSPPPPYTVSTPIISNPPSQPTPLPPTQIVPPSLAGFDFDFTTSPQHPNPNPNPIPIPIPNHRNINTTTHTTTPPYTNSSQSRTLHQSFWSSEHIGGRSDGFKAARVLGVDTGSSPGTGTAMGMGNNGPLAHSKMSSTGVKGKSSNRLSRMFRRKGESGRDF